MVPPHVREPAPATALPAQRRRKAVSLPRGGNDRPSCCFEIVAARSRAAGRVPAPLFATLLKAAPAIRAIHASRGARTKSRWARLPPRRPLESRNCGESWTSDRPEAERPAHFAAGRPTVVRRPNPLAAKHFANRKTSADRAGADPAAACHSHPTRRGRVGAAGALTGRT